MEILNISEIVWYENVVDISYRSIRPFWWLVAILTDYENG